MKNAILFFYFLAFPGCLFSGGDNNTSVQNEDVKRSLDSGTKDADTSNNTDFSSNSDVSNNKDTSNNPDAPNDTESDLPDILQEKYIQISAGQNHTCALLANGEAKCWGKNYSGSTTVPNETLFKHISAGFYQTCGIKDDETLKCWGNMNNLPGGPGASGIFRYVDVGEVHACSLNTENDMECWGDDARAGFPLFKADTTAVSVSKRGTCRILEDDETLECWGADINSPPSGKFKALDCGTFHCCAIGSDDEFVQCWGSTGSGVTTNLPTEEIQKISSGLNRSCGLFMDGTATCWGTQLTMAVPRRPFFAITTGALHSCAIDKMGEIICWGDDGEMQLQHR